MTLCLSQIEQQLFYACRTAGSTTGVGPPALESNAWRMHIVMRIQSEANLREHWAKKAKRVKRQRQLVGMILWNTELCWKRPRPELPVTVLLTRIAARKLDDDNLCGGFKAVRDEVAAWLGVNDNDPRVTWRYAQERGKGFACRIQIGEAVR